MEDSTSREVATAELAAVLTELGFDVETSAGPRDLDLVLAGQVLIDVKTSSRPNLGWLRRRVLEQTNSSVLPVLVADQVDPGLKRELEAAGWGWLDRSGHLRLVRGGLQVDRRIPSLAGLETTPVDPLARPTGLAVALSLLEGSTVGSVRGLAAAAGISNGAAHSALSELTTLGLVEDGKRRDPDLFWAVAARWVTRWYALGAGPGPGIPPAVHRLLRFGLDDVEAPGWAEVGDRIAQGYGARVAGEGPPRFYLPDQRALTWALRTWEPALDDRAATAFLSVPPTTSATARRVELGNEFPAARPIVVALDLAADGSPRSREVLEDWRDIRGRQPRVW
jgi:hypothetical protein